MERRRVYPLFKVLALAAVIPLVGFAGWAALVSAQRSRSEAQALARITTDRVAERLSAEIATQLVIVEALSLSPGLDGELSSFHKFGLRLASTNPLWETVSISDPEARQILNVLHPLGDPLAPDPDPASLQEVIRTKRPAVGGIGSTENAGPLLIPLRVPVIRDARLRYVLTVGLNSERMGRILAEAGAPEGWSGILSDRNGRVVARTAEVQPVEPDPERAAETRTLKGTNGWTVRFEIPRSRLNASVHRSQGLLAAGAIGSLSLSGLLSVLVARELAARRALETERASLALRLSEQKGALAIEAAELGTWWVDPQTGRLGGSDRAAELVGLQAVKPLASWTSLLDVVHPEDRAAVREARNRGMEHSGLVEVEFRVRHSRDWRWLRAVGQQTMRSRRRLVYGVLADVDSRKRAEEERGHLLRRLARAEEEERRRISRELHDQIGQAVTGLLLGLKTLEGQLDGTRKASCTLSQVRWMQRLAQQIGEDVHRVSMDLRPSALDDLGLIAVVHALASDTRQRHELKVDVQVLGFAGRLSTDVETTIYRAVQEALTNVLKHARAGIVSVVLERKPDELRVIVDDDGVGFDPDTLATQRTRSVGLVGMRERLAMVGGTLTVEAVPGCGTTLFICIPIRPNELPEVAYESRAR